MKPLNHEHIKNVIALEAFARYQYFMGKVADWTSMFTLNASNGDVAISELDGNFLLPLWPFKEFAELQKDRWGDFNATEISIDRFEEVYIPIIEKRGYSINVFPVNETTGFVVNLEEFIKDLRDELSQYE